MKHLYSTVAYCRFNNDVTSVYRAMWTNILIHGSAIYPVFPNYSASTHQKTSSCTQAIRSYYFIKKDTSRLLGFKGCIVGYAEFYGDLKLFSSVSERNYCISSSTVAVLTLSETLYLNT